MHNWQHLTSYGLITEMAIHSSFAMTMSKTWLQILPLAEPMHSIIFTINGRARSIHKL